MALVFVPGPFADPAVLGAALGTVAARLEPAVLAGYGLLLRRDPLAATLSRADAIETSGGLAAFDVQQESRIASVFAALGARVEPMIVATTAGTVATAFVSTEPPALLDGTAELDPEARAWLAEAVGEIAALGETRTPDAVRALLPGIGYRALGRARAPADAPPARARAGLAADGDVELLELRRPYARYFAVEEHRLRHRRFDGRMSRALERAVFASGDAVTVLPFDPDRRTVLLVEQFRAGPHARRDPHPWSLEAVAGRCDPGEDPETTARREAREEAGVELGRLERVAAYYPSPGLLSEHITSFVGAADLGAAGGVHGLPSEDEDIRALVLPLSEAVELAALGEINNGPLLVTLLWLAPRAERLAADWGP